MLSVARGSKVTDVYREERDADGQLIARVHRSAVTKNLKGAEIHIRERTNDPDRTLSEARVELRRLSGYGGGLVFLSLCYVVLSAGSTTCGPALSVERSQGSGNRRASP